MDIPTAIVISSISLFLALPAMTFCFVSSMIKKRVKLQELQLQKQILELETKKQEDQIKLLEAENKKLDNIIYEK